MYWERGGSLKKLYDGITEKNIRFGGKLGWTRLFLVVCEALDYLQRLELVHGDLCSDNIVLSTDGSVKLTDLGTLTFTGTVEGGRLRTRSLMEYLLDDSWDTNQGTLGEEKSTVIFSLGKLGSIINDCKQISPLNRPSADILLNKLFWDHLNSFIHDQPPIFC